MTKSYNTLRDANVARSEIWDSKGQQSLSFKGNELAGEVGEACNVIKKIERERLGLRGSRATLKDLADELADVVICADLIALDQGIDLQEAIACKFNYTSSKYDLPVNMALPPRKGDEPTVTMLFVSTADDVAIAESIANHLKKPVVIVRPDGSKNYVIPMETGVFDVEHDHSRADDDGMPPVREPSEPSPKHTYTAPGPMHHAEDEIGFGEPYDSFGG